MQGTRAVQVVLGEGEPGILRLILEAQGFHVVGHARGDDELRRVVALTRPSVIVLDAGISALAAIDAQVRSDGAPIVVVWPKDVFTPVAEERVDPSHAFLELGNAVRRVVERHGEPVRIPDAEDEVRPVERMASQEPAVAPRRRSSRRRHALVVATAWTIALTALAAIGLAVPSALRVFQPAGTLHPSLDRPEVALTPDREAPGGGPADVRPDPACANGRERPTGPPTDRGRPDDPGRGCAASGRDGGGAVGRRNGAHGRPDDPGRASDRRGRDGQGGPKDEPPGNDAEQGGADEHVGGDDRGDHVKDGPGTGQDGSDGGGSGNGGGGETDPGSASGGGAERAD